MNEKNKQNAKFNDSYAMVAEIVHIYNYILETEHIDHRKEAGLRIKKERLKRGLTLEEFGKLFNPIAAKGLVSRWESGKTTPNFKRRLQLSKMTGQPDDYYSPQYDKESDYRKVLSWLKQLKETYPEWIKTN